MPGVQWLWTDQEGPWQVDVIGDLITNQDNSVLLWTTDLVIL